MLKNKKENRQEQGKRLIAYVQAFKAVKEKEGKEDGR